MKIENRMYKTPEAAKLLGVSQRTLYNYIYAEQIKVIRRASIIYIDGEELEAFLKRDLPKGYYKKLYGSQGKTEP